MRRKIKFNHLLLLVPTLFLFGLTAWAGGANRDSAYEKARAQMVRTQIENRGVSDPATLKAMQEVPRHLFVPPRRADEAYGDWPLPIGFGQTISQPYIVAAMTETVHPGSGKKVLEVGTGSGYQAAVLAATGAQVFTIEIIPELAESAAERLRRLGYAGVQVKEGDGYFGWEEHAPFDAIVVTAAASHIPPPFSPS